MAKLLLLGFLVNIGGVLCAMDMRDQHVAAVGSGRLGKQAQSESKDTPRSIGSQSSPRMGCQGEPKDTPRSIGSQLSSHMSRKDDLKDTPRSRGSQLSPLMNHRVNSWLSYWITFCERMSADTNAEINREQTGASLESPSERSGEGVKVGVDMAKKIEAKKIIEEIMGAPMPVFSDEIKRHLESIESDRSRKTGRSNTSRTTLDTLPEKDESGLSELGEDQAEEDATSRSSERSLLPRQPHQFSAQQVGVPVLNLSGATPLDYLFENREGND